MNVFSTCFWKINIIWIKRICILIYLYIPKTTLLINPISPRLWILTKVQRRQSLKSCWLYRLLVRFYSREKNDFLLLQFPIDHDKSAGCSHPVVKILSWIRVHAKSLIWISLLLSNSSHQLQPNGSIDPTIWIWHADLTVYSPFGVQFSGNGVHYVLLICAHLGAEFTWRWTPRAE